MGTSPPIPNELLARHDVLIASDNQFQRAARLLQALWREERGYPTGLHRGRPLGSRIDATFARATLANFLSDAIRDAVRHTIEGDGRSPGQLINQDRLYEDLPRLHRNMQHRARRHPPHTVRLTPTPPAPHRGNQLWAVLMTDGRGPDAVKPSAMRAPHLANDSTHVELR